MQEKKLGRRVSQGELFAHTHIKKKKNPTDEDRWVEPRAKETHVRTIFILINFYY